MNRQLPFTVKLKSGEDISLRYAARSDYSTIVQVSERAVPEMFGPSSSWPELIQTNFVIVAEIDDEAVGFGVYEPAHDSQPDKLEGIYVLTEHQNKGIGSQLLACLESIAINRRIQTIYLDAAWGSEARWAAKGYVCVEREEPIVRMQKDLSEKPEQDS